MIIHLKLGFFIIHRKIFSPFIARILYLFQLIVLPALLVSPSICCDRVFKVSVVWDKGRHLFYIHQLFVLWGNAINICGRQHFLDICPVFSYPEVHMLFAGMQRYKVRFENWPYDSHRAEVTSEVSE